MPTKKMFTNRIVVRTDRLLIRKAKISDAENLFKLYSNKDVVKYIMRDKTITQTISIINKYNHFAKLEIGMILVVFNKRTKDFIGVFSFLECRKRDKKTGISCDILKKYWNKGYATEIIKKMLEISITKFHLNRIEAKVHSKNLVALHLLNKFGFKQEGLLRESAVINEKFSDELIFSLLKNEWRHRETFY